MSKDILYNDRYTILKCRVSVPTKPMLYEHKTPRGQRFTQEVEQCLAEVVGYKNFQQDAFSPYYYPIGKF